MRTTVLAFSVVILTLVAASFTNAAMNLWDALAQGMQVNLNGPTESPAIYEEKLCSQSPIQCYECEHYDDDALGCHHKPDCMVSCNDNRCVKSDNKKGSCKQCHDTCVCQLKPHCFYRDSGETGSWCSKLPSNKTRLFAMWFTENECYRGSRDPYVYYLYGGRLLPMDRPYDTDACDVDAVIAQYDRESESVFDDNSSDRCIVLSSKLERIQSYYELVVVFDQLVNWLPQGDHRVFSISFGKSRHSVTFKRGDFPDAEKIVLMWSFYTDEHVTGSSTRDFRVRGIHGSQHPATHEHDKPFDIVLCDHPVGNCFQGNGVVRPASIRWNNFGPPLSKCEHVQNECDCLLHRSNACKFIDNKCQRDPLDQEWNACYNSRYDPYDSRLLCAWDDHPSLQDSWIFGFYWRARKNLCWIKGAYGPNERCVATEILIAINFNGEKYKDRFGIEYVPDEISDDDMRRLNLKKHQLTKKMCLDTEKPNTFDDPVHGTFIESGLEDSSTKQCLTYNVPIKDGQYILLIKMVDPFVYTFAQRLFDIELNGQTVKSNVDIFTLSGRKFNAYYKAGICATVQFLLFLRVDNNQLNVEHRFLTQVENGEITLSFCTGSCSKAQNSNFIVSSFTIFRYYSY